MSLKYYNVNLIQPVPLILIAVAVKLKKKLFYI